MNFVLNRVTGRPEKVIGSDNERNET